MVWMIGLTVAALAYGLELEGQKQSRRQTRAVHLLLGIPATAATAYRRETDQRPNGEENWPIKFGKQFRVWVVETCSHIINYYYLM